MTTKTKTTRRRATKPTYLVRVTVDGGQMEFFYNFAGLVSIRAHAHVFTSHTEAATIADLVNGNPVNRGAYHATVITTK